MGEVHDQFKRELKSYRFYKQEIIRLKEMIVQIDDNMLSISSPPLDKIPSHTNSNAKLDMIIKKDELEKKIKAMQIMIDYVDKSLNKLSDEESEILKDIYINKVPVDRISRTHYMSERKIFRWINRTIDKAVK